MANLTIEQMSYSEMEAVKDLVAASGNLPYQYHSGISRDKLAQFHYRKCAEAVSAAKLQLLAAKVEGRPVGLLMLEHLPWDTEVLGVNCFAIRDLVAPEGPGQDELANRLVSFAVESCTSQGCELLVAKTDPVAHYLVRAFGLAGFEHMSTLIFYGFDMRRLSVPALKGPFTYRPFEEKDEEPLQEVARKGFAQHYDRYAIDRRIPPEAAARVHREWVKNSCRGYADQVFVAADGDNLIGFGTWKFEKSSYETLGVRIARYDLGAVDPAYRGQGVFKAMTVAGMQWLAGKVDILEGPTNIRNYPTQRALTSLGWRLVGSRYNYHRWLK